MEIIIQWKEKKEKKDLCPVHSSPSLQLPEGKRFHFPARKAKLSF